jgi:hypothetical protein
MLAVKLSSDGNESDRYLLRRAGLDLEGSFNIALFNLQRGDGFLDPYNWAGAPMVRTLTTAHKYIEENFDALETGSVIDVEFILGETKTIKRSEAITCAL